MRLSQWTLNIWGKEGSYTFSYSCQSNPMQNATFLGNTIKIIYSVKDLETYDWENFSLSIVFLCVSSETFRGIYTNGLIVYCLKMFLQSKVKKYERITATRVQCNNLERNHVRFHLYLMWTTTSCEVNKGWWTTSENFHVIIKKERGVIILQDKFVQLMLLCVTQLFKRGIPPTYFNKWHLI